MRILRGIFFPALVFVVLSAPVLAESRRPVVFAHGVGVPAQLYDTFSPLKRVFRELGYEVHVARTPVNGTLDERAEALAREILRLVPGGEYHLVGHSMGGLDARLAIHRYGLGDRCLSLTTLATPHRGSPLADWVVERYGALGVHPGVEEALVALGGDIRAVRNLTTHHLQKRFNPAVPDDPRVRYFSMAFYVPEPAVAYATVPFLWAAHAMLKALGHPLNDGPVPAESAVWGEFLGSFPGDHYSETAPVPFGGRMIYRQVFERVLKNLDREF